jgi:small redox-active disulfide protein 2
MKKLQILGGGCAKCGKLAEVTKQAATELGIEFEIEKVTEMAKIIEFGVMTTPALVVDGDVKVSGKVPSLADVKKMIGG